MSNYNSENTKVLETYDDNGNTRMLLMHEMDCGRHEYVIGSYFTETPYARVTFGDVPTTKNLVEYSWDWGHYFQRFEDAARYWLDEVIGVEFGFEAYDERSGFSEGEVFAELGDAIDAYVNWDFLNGGKKKRIYSIIGEDEVTLAECER